MQGQWLGTWGGDWLGGVTAEGNPIVIAALHATGSGSAVLAAQTINANPPPPASTGGGYSRAVPMQREVSKKRENDEAFLLFVL